MTKTVEVTDNSPLLALSECKRTEERLRGSENRYRLVAENAADAIWTVGINMQPTYFSPSIARLLGYSVEEAMVRTMEEVFTPDSFELAMKVLAEEMAIEKTEQKDPSRSRTLEFELKRKDGSIVPVEIKHSFLRGPDGQPVEILAIARDITERKRVEEALIESEQKTRTFMDSVTDLFVIAGRNENILYVNEAMVRTLGYSKEALLGMNISELLSEESKANFIPKVKELVATGKITTENMWLTKDGKKIVGELVVNAIYDSEGNYSGSRGVFRDITERKAAEDKLRESEEKYRKLFELSPIGITTLDMKGVITASNPAAYKVGGYSENEFVGKHFSRIAPVRLRDIPRYMKAFGSIVRGKVPKPFDMAYQCKDGTTGWTELSIALLEAGGKKLGVQVIQRDVTEQRWAEEALRESEERYRHLFDNLGDAAFLADAETGLLIETNQQGELMLGRSRDEIVGMHQSELHPPGQADKYRQKFDAHIQQGHVADYDGEVIRKDGTIVSVRISASTLTIRGHQLILGLFRDITEPKRVEEALRAEERNFRNSLGDSPLGIRIINADGNTIYTNQALLDIYGYSSIEELKAVPASERYTPESYAEQQERVRKREAGEPVPDQFELNIVRKDGEIRNLEVFHREILWGGERQFQLIYYDITEQKRARQQVEQAAQEWRSTFDAISDWISICDKDFKIIRVNKAFADAFGMKPAQLIGKPCYEIFHGTNEPISDCPLRKAIETKRSTMTEFFEPHLGIHLEVSASPIFNEKGEVIACVHVVRDITERKRMEEEVLAKSRQLEMASRAKSEFLAHMSHELRTPLNVIIGFTELMLDGVTGRLKKEQRQCLNDVLNSGRHLLGLISDVLDLSKIESGKMELRMKNIDLPDIIESLRSQIMPVIRPRKQKLELDVEGGLPLVYADKSKVRQVLLNLLSNATKFTPDGGKLKIEAVSEDGWCRVSVIDSGTGIKEDDQKKIFEPFSQLDNSSLAREEGGTGLGLPITRQIVDRHGGRIWVESECGKGSSFIFTLPLATHGQPHPRRRNKAAGEGGNGR
ncbi:MAG TPA: PAS domain S-box protein [Dehalococcoidales bacterium]|nr:PAS domain S-box protein [Dehalococcoidales bacterium]